MMIPIAILVLFCLSAISKVAAFSAAAFEDAVKSGRDVEISGNLEKAFSKLQLTRRTPAFDISSQLVSITGSHAFIAPNFAAGDQRGNCPGLNAMANHGYIPRNGIATTQQFVDGSFNVFGMGRDLGLILSTYGSVMNGDLSKFSIGGPTPNVPGVLGLLGTPQGLSANSSHNRYEGDASATRGDLYLYGDSSKLVMSNFEQLFDMQSDPATANYDLSVIFPFRAARYQHSVENNPHFFYAPASGILASSAAHYFIYRMFGNKSAESPEGTLNQEVIKSFFSITGPRSSFTYTHGNERIPTNWHRCNPLSPYDFPSAISDILAAGLIYPQFLTIGGNLGTVNSFTPVDIRGLTGGVYNAQSLFQGNNAICFAVQVLRLATPDLVSGPGGLLGGLLSPLVGGLNTLTGVVNGLIGGLGCPNLGVYDTSAFDVFPGARQGSA